MSDLVIVGIVALCGVVSRAELLAGGSGMFVTVVTMALSA
jgi:hypothetical protein